MGSVANAVKNAGNGLGKVTSSGNAAFCKQGGNLTRNFSNNIGAGSKLCPVVNEFRNISEGLA